VAGSWYRETVRDRFWVPLSDRDAELAELAAFCVRPEGSDYTWWQADAYAGKTVLMANLVLEPPPKVRVVAFFVTARIAGQDDREAFIDNVLEQLAALRQNPVPAVTAPAVLAGGRRACRRPGRTGTEAADQDRDVSDTLRCFRDSCSRLADLAVSARSRAARA
jgi:hypothetical protein